MISFSLTIAAACVLRDFLENPFRDLRRFLSGRYRKKNYRGMYLYGYLLLLH